ncbi:MAG: DUF4258 domain-containing protein [ANME-2 cluster archaeon]|nr:DUF4258 domain-containing protein [ANME-2 cluster archaeon]MBC2700138.1 DUF4258 domain-containing protein [ANME-2 cluster archaeon]MBC2708764.1 DUF4258 domain-containing protein [ANME-2 cluster archaeon]MBC2748276.1 DUF4258 domain-containing protein [ANME-2 cluster archaeon]
MVKVIFTKHAEEMLLERNFSRYIIKSVIDNPDWKEDKKDELR